MKKEGGSARDLVLLTIDEAMDVARARRAEAEIAAAPAGGQLVLDLSEVPSFDFSGISVLLDALARLRDRFSEVSILGLSERIRSVFDALQGPETQPVYVCNPRQRERRPF